MAILDLQGMEVPEGVSRSSNKSIKDCGNIVGGGGKGPSKLSLLLC